MDLTRFGGGGGGQSAAVDVVLGTQCGERGGKLVERFGPSLAGIWAGGSIDRAGDRGSCARGNLQVVGGDQLCVGADGLGLAGGGEALVEARGLKLLAAGLRR
jgi:hypothetical protein